MTLRIKDCAPGVKVRATKDSSSQQLIKGRIYTLRELIRNPPWGGGHAKVGVRIVEAPNRAWLETTSDAGWRLDRFDLAEDWDD